MKRILIALLCVALAVVLGAPLTLWIGAYAALDHDLGHSRATSALDAFDAAGSASATPALSLIEAGSMTFRARTAGFGGDRGNVILLHGFPESSAMYLPAHRTASLKGGHPASPARSPARTGDDPRQVCTFGT